MLCEQTPVVILAGGKGTRLKPYTTSLPKPLMPVGEYPILDILLRQLGNQGFKRITLAVGHLAGFMCLLRLLELAPDRGRVPQLPLGLVVEDPG